MKKIVMLLAAGCAIGMLTGCGVPEEEHLAALANLEAKHDAAVDVLDGKIAKAEDDLKSERAKMRTARIELDDASERITGLQQKSADVSKALAAEKSKVTKLESAVKSAKSQIDSAKSAVAASEAKCETLEAELQDVTSRFEMFQKNMSSMSKPEVVEEAAPAAEVMDSDAKKASKMFDDMSTM